MPAGAARRGWRGSRFTAVAVEDGGREARLGLLPIVSGRLALGEAATVGMSPSLGSAVREGYLVAWDPGSTSAFVASAIGDRPESWLGRTIGIRGLVHALERDRADVAWSDMASVARHYRVLHARSGDALRQALTVGELFLVLATKLEMSGRGDVRSLVGAGGVGARVAALSSHPTHL